MPVLLTGLLRTSVRSHLTVVDPLTRPLASLWVLDASTMCFRMLAANRSAAGNDWPIWAAKRDAPDPEAGAPFA